MDDNTPKRKVGRPLKFATVQAMQQSIDQYFGECDPHKAKRNVWIEGADAAKGYWAEVEYITEQKPYTITGLAIALDTNRFTLINYQNPKHYPAEMADEVVEEFIDTIARAKVRCEQYAEQHLYTGKSANGAIFNLKNNYGWVDESTVNNRTVEEDLDELDGEVIEEGATEAANAAAAEISKTEGNSGDEGPATSQQVVAADAPIQDQG